MLSHSLFAENNSKKSKEELVKHVLEERFAFMDKESNNFSSYLENLRSDLPDDNFYLSKTEHLKINDNYSKYLKDGKKDFRAAYKQFKTNIFTNLDKDKVKHIDKMVDKINKQFTSSDQVFEGYGYQKYSKKIFTIKNDVDTLKSYIQLALIESKEKYLNIAEPEASAEKSKFTIMR